MDDDVARHMDDGIIIFPTIEHRLILLDDLNTSPHQRMLDHWFIGHRWSLFPDSKHFVEFGRALTTSPSTIDEFCWRLKILRRIWSALNVGHWWLEMSPGQTNSLPNFTNAHPSIVRHRCFLLENFQHFAKLVDLTIDHWQILLSNLTLRKFSSKTLMNINCQSDPFHNPHFNLSHWSHQSFKWKNPYELLNLS